MDTQLTKQPTRQPLTRGDRLWASLMDMAAIGAIAGGGSCRLSLTNEDKLARDLFANWAREAGCGVHVDRYGNMFGIRPGRLSNAPIVLVGSHLDTQPHGGRFDGVLGVLAGLEVIRALNDAGIETDHPIAVVNWTNEEGVRFKPGLTGSKGFVGDLDAASLQGTEGADYFAELERIGYAGDPNLRLNVLCYYELHIEQGPSLEQERARVGVVAGVQGVRWFEIDIAGKDAHAGTTPIVARSDSFMAASALAIALRQSAISLSPDLRFTIGRVEVSPNSTNTVPGRTRLFIDLRHTDPAIMDAFKQTMAHVIERVSAQEHVQASVSQLMDVAPVRFDTEMQARLAACAHALEVLAPTLESGAMHDASSLASVVPTAMLFVQSRDGISHNPREWSEPGHVATACEILAQAVLSHAIGSMPEHT
ncbi:Zn-dependent hydrolase [Mesorhizobium sp. M7A.F.Ca.US.006.01.1.1]|uniref:M20 family metallo-hydrolase n=1 Tax=Mesorhizobium sp. M7A.F.Ca.US.006.01.1.1 TaxID=2496707 RepID=UPI000FCA14CD|nr:M20 family metallo-hydrolase [Mesorhizobium sp. M7A.F.Ca.US.006.01.1.1]RUZ77853.1 Zn-dependent hydrolase [Mesorhizobium sp. M7A.F.Ca.US.006.01.1.1]